MIKQITKIFSCISVLLIPIYSLSQDYSWWNEKHNWDGVTSWNKYIIISPAFMGPNALPVPEIHNGILSNKCNFKFALDGHFSKGDQTENIFTELYIPLAKDKVGLNINVVPIEHYAIDTTTRDLRRIRDYDGEGLAGGDIYVSTLIQLIKDKEKWPDILLTINLKTASGTNLAAARYSDTPGYYFDLSFSKSIEFNESRIKSIRPFILGGFYSWQTYQDDNSQNDAALFGLGMDLNLDKILIKNTIGGYAGYVGNGDKPLVYRFLLRSTLNTIVNYEFRFQQGINDFDYSSFRFGLNFDLSKFIQVQ